MTKPQLVPTLDLRPVTKGSCLTIVKLFPSWSETSAFNWILAGEIKLEMDRRNHHLTCYLAGCRDREHSAAHAFDLPIIGVTFQGIYMGITTLGAWIDPNYETSEFYVPSPGWDPLKKSKPCLDCDREEAPHLITDYLPPPNPKLYREVKGKKIEISIGPAFDWRLP